jgi:hypothetical protein
MMLFVINNACRAFIIVAKELTAEQRNRMMIVMAVGRSTTSDKKQL